MKTGSGRGRGRESGTGGKSWRAEWGATRHTHRAPQAWVLPPPPRPGTRAGAGAEGGAGVHLVLHARPSEGLLGAPGANAVGEASRRYHRVSPSTGLDEVSATEQQTRPYS